MRSALPLLALSFAATDAKTYYVINSLADAIEAPFCAPLDSPDGTNPAGRYCTYREAIRKAGEAKDSTPIEIVLPPGQINITKTLPVLQQYDEQKSVTIVGNSNTSILTNPNITDSWKTILDGQDAHILLEIKKEIIVQVESIYFQHGAAAASATSGLERNGGAIVSSGKVTIKSCHFTACRALSSGGAVANDGGTLDISDSTFVKNIALNGGGLSSAGKGSMLRMQSCTFSDNVAQEAAGALQISRTAVAYIVDTQFDHHFANATGGSVQNGVNSNMSLSGCSFKISKAKNAGIISNSGIAQVYNSSFEGGFAFDQYGGAVDNQGDFTCVLCKFANNTAQATPEGGHPIDPTASEDANGATLNMDQKMGATALLLNCTVEGSDSYQQNPVAVSEFYLANTDVQLNLTFVNFTKCHDNMILVNHDKTQANVTMRGVRFCDIDKTETAGSCAIFDSHGPPPHLKPGCNRVAKTCADTPDDAKAGVWKCGERAKCTDLYDVPGRKLNGGAGMACSCDKPLHFEPPMPKTYTEMWGHAYGGAAPDFDLITGTWPEEKALYGAGFAGCFEQWNPYVANITATKLSLLPPTGKDGDAELLELHPLFHPVADVDTTDALYTCTTRQAPGLNWTVTANKSDHNHINGKELATETFVVEFGPGESFVSTTFMSRAFDANITAAGKLVSGSAKNYTLNATMVDGDLLCGAGVMNTTCFNTTGEALLCVAQNYAPEKCRLADGSDYGQECERFNGTMNCSLGPKTAPACNYAAWEPDMCMCADCLAGASYACQCNDTLTGLPEQDGTQLCSVEGALGDCDCKASFAAPPSPPPPNPPPAPPPVWPMIVFPSLVGAGLLGAGLWCWMKKRRNAQMQRDYQAALLNAAGNQPGEGGDGEYTLR